MGIAVTNEVDDLEALNHKLKKEESAHGVPIHRLLLSKLSNHINHVRQVSNSGPLFPSFEQMKDKGRYARSNS